MHKSVMTLIVISFIPNYFKNDDSDQWNKTRAVKEVPFCAFILREFLDDKEQNRDVYVLMEPDQVIEINLDLLFKALSKKFPQPYSLTIWVETDVEQLGVIATGRMGTVSPAESEKENPEEKAVKPQLAYYRRTKKVELFRYNPNYPHKNGEKTVIIRGKE